MHKILLASLLVGMAGLSSPAFSLEANWDRCMDSVLTWEGGWTGPRPQEPGGYAMRGISYQTFKDWRAKRGQPEPTPDDLHNLSLEETKKIYFELYGKRIDFDSLPSGFDCALLHGAVMFGTGEGSAERPGAAKLRSNSGDDLGRLIVLMMQAKMYREDCGPSVNAATGKPMWLCKGWADRFKAVYDIAKSMQDGQR